MDKMLLIDELKHKNEILPNEFDGTYRCVRKAMEYYANLRRLTVIDISDLELLYYLSLGCWGGSMGRLKELIQESHLLHSDKHLLETTANAIWDRESMKLFSHILSTKHLEFLTASNSL